MPPLITLTTDFGLSDHYVGVMKGVILDLAPTAVIVDITHDLSADNLLRAAVVVANTVPYFAAGTIHVVVVDPGVGTDRRVLLAETGDQLILAPDNGVLTLVLSVLPPARITAVTAARFFRPTVSRTFHGRDVFAPVAAHLANGLSSAELGPAVDDPIMLDWPAPRVAPDRVEGQVIYADRFGNLVTTISAAAARALGKEIVAVVAGCTCPLVGAYGEGAPGALIALVGSSELVELSVVGGSAREQLGAAPGTLVTLVQAARR